MDLRNFIKQSLVEVMLGLEDAQQSLAGKTTGHICPTVAIWPSGAGTAAGSRPLDLIEFDIAVEATTEAGQGGGISVLGGIVKAGAKVDSRDTERQASRIKFSVPIAYPDTGEPTAHVPSSSVKISQ